MRLLKPRIAMLDEIDSGLDVDAINVVSDVINEEHARGAGILVISHYARLLDLVKPTRAAIIINGRIVVSGGPEIIKRVDTEGYEWIKTELGIEIAKEINPAMNQVSIGVCATREAVKNEK
jgi:Fe-S cluster assembly ATP-binding protein